MKLLVYALQSSGASLFTYFLGQKPRSVAVIDLWAVNSSRLDECASFAPTAPALPDELDSVVKCVITTGVGFERHRSSYRPDASILFLRHPCHNYVSLSAKGYRNDGGPIDSKFRLLDTYFQRRTSFDLVLCYEDFVDNPRGTVAALAPLRWGVAEPYYRFGRSIEEIVQFNRDNVAWCREHYGPPMPAQWGTGNVRDRKINPALTTKRVSETVKQKVASLCPLVLEHYALRERQLRPLADA